MNKDTLNTMDPNILLSMVNMKLRDYFSSLKELCEDLEVTEDDIKGKLKEIDYEYDEEINQFK